MELEQVADINLQFYSQHGQDKFLYENFFFNKTSGIFVEIGAYDGISYSNTYFFEKYLSWSGICIEPLKREFAKLQKNRNCICLNECISSKNEKVIFYELTGGDKWTKYCCGILKYYPKQFKKIIKDEIMSFSGEAKLYSLNTATISEVCLKNNIKKIDYLSLDVEGAELEILSDEKFSELEIEIISVENLGFTSHMKTSMRNLGFEFVQKIGFDEIYRRI